MRMRFNMLVGVALVGCASFVAAQTETQTTTQTETKFITVDGEVVRYEPGKVIVIRGTDKAEVIYNLSPTVTVPADIQVGRRVTLYTEPVGGIDFPDAPELPDYMDFVYVAFTVGMTFQVSDTNIADRAIRRTIVRHSMLSYLFGTVIVGVTINVVGNLVH